MKEEQLRIDLEKELDAEIAEKRCKLNHLKLKLELLKMNISINDN